MILSKGDLHRITDDSPLRTINEHNLYSEDDADASVFLSHKHSEKNILLEVKSFLEHLNMKVYVDWMKNNMQHPTNIATAEELKKQIKNQNKFILIATEDAISSPWCNWELGLADQIKSGEDSIAILPLSDNSKNWEHNEYLILYPSIEFFDGTTYNTKKQLISKGYYVRYPAASNGNRRYKLLKDWLHEGMPSRKVL